MLKLKRNMILACLLLLLPLSVTAGEVKTDIIYPKEGIALQASESEVALWIEDARTDSEGVKRAQMRFEISEKPIDEFTGKAETYQARGNWNPRYDAGKLGGWLDYR